MADKTDDLILSISSDTAPLKRALRILGAEVDRFSKDSIAKFEKAGAGIDKSMTTAMQQRIDQMVGIGTKASKEWNGALSQQGAELDKLRTKYSPIYAAIKQYQASVVSIQQANRLGAISADEMAAAIQRERRATLDSISAIKQRNNAVASGRNSGGPSRFNTANIAAQFQDIAVTSAMGMSPIQIALQQGTQLSAVFNEMGKGKAVIQGIGEAFTSIISPVSLVTIGVIAAGTAIAQYIASSGDVKTVDDIIKQHEEHIKRLGPAYEQAIKEQQKYVTESPAVVGISLKDDQRQALETQAKEAAAAVRSIFLASMSPTDSTQVSNAFKPAEQAMAAFFASVRDGSPKVASFREEIGRLSETGQLTQNAAAKLLKFTDAAFDAESRLGNVSGEVDKYAAAFGALQDAINRVSSDKAREEAQKLYEKFTDGTASVDDLRKALGDLSANAPDLQGAISEILRLAGAAANAKAEIDSIWQGASGKGDRTVGLDPKAFSDRFGGNQDAADQLKRQRDELEKKPKKTDAERQAQRDANAYRDLVKSAQDRIDQLKLEEQLVGKTGVAAETMRMKLELLQKAQDKGRSVSEAQRAEIDKLATAYGKAAEKVSAMQMVEELQFERAQMFRSPTEQKVYGSLRSAGINPDSEYGQAIGNQIRLNEQLAIGRERALDFAQGLANDIMNSADAVDILRNSVSRLAQMLIEMGTNSAINGFFANFGGGLGGGSFTPTTTLGNFLKGIPGFAGGTDSAPPGFAWVGEKGPELVRFGGGEQVVPNDILRSMANRSVSGPRVPNVPSAANSASQTGVHVTLGWSSDSDGNIAPIIKSVAQREVKTGLTAFDKTGAMRTARDLRQVNSRGLAR